SFAWQAFHQGDAPHLTRTGRRRGVVLRHVDECGRSLQRSKPRKCDVRVEVVVLEFETCRLHGGLGDFDQLVQGRWRLGYAHPQDLGRVGVGKVPQPLELQGKGTALYPDSSKGRLEIRYPVGRNWAQEVDS